MTKFFGEYLVEKKIISQNDLLEALVLQVQNTPTFLEVAFKHSIFQPEQILSILKNQVVEGVEFKVSAQSLGLWTLEAERQIQDALVKERVPLGKILLSQKKLEVKDLIAALDQFLADQLDAQSEVVQEVEKLDEKAGDDLSTTPAPLSTDLSSSEEMISARNCFLSHFSQELHLKIKGLVLELDLTHPEFSDQILSIQNELNSILKQANLSNLKQSQELLEKVLAQSKKLVELSEESGEKVVWDFKSTTKKILDVLWEIRNAIELGQSEIEYLSSSESDSDIGSLLQELDRLSVA